MRNIDQVIYQLSEALSKKDWCLIWQINTLKDFDFSHLKSLIPVCISALKYQHHGFQREILKLIQKIDIEDDLTGILWDTCLSLWLNTKNKPSTRIKALELLTPIAVKYPSLRIEFLELNTRAHIEALSPGIRRSCLKIIQLLNTNPSE